MSGPESERRPLVKTAEAARAVGIPLRTFARYAERGYLKPAQVMPSGQRRWDVADLRRQLEALQRERES